MAEGFAEVQVPAGCVEARPHPPGRRAGNVEVPDQGVAEESPIAQIEPARNQPGTGPHPGKYSQGSARAVSLGPPGSQRHEEYDDGRHAQGREFGQQRRAEEPGQRRKGDRTNALGEKNPGPHGEGRAHPRGQQRLVGHVCGHVEVHRKQTDAPDCQAGPEALAGPDSPGDPSGDPDIGQPGEKGDGAVDNLSRHRVRLGGEQPDQGTGEQVEKRRMIG